MAIPLSVWVDPEWPEAMKKAKLDFGKYMMKARVPK
jgi:hypothetical protein